MNFCRRCGEPKEFHGKPRESSSAHLPKMGAPHLRLCPVSEVDDGEDRPWKLFRMNPKKRIMQQAAYDEERRMRFDDEPERVRPNYRVIRGSKRLRPGDVRTA